MDKVQIRRFAEEIKIPALVHFTPIGNLESILKNGLLCRNDIDDNAEINDQLRLDGRKNTISTSIAFPNSNMFYKYRQEKGGLWAVVAISKRVLWDLDCLFCEHNAADARIAGLPEDYLCTVDAFKSMYDEQIDLPNRQEQSLRTYDPTDVQAEVLIKHHVPAKYIVGVVFPDARTKDKYAHLTTKRKVVEHSRNKGFFASRSYVRR